MSLSACQFALKKACISASLFCPHSVCNGQPFPRAGLSGLMAYCQPL